MNLISIRIITEDVKKLVSFYEQVTGMKAVQYTDDFAELKTSSATLAIGSTRTLQFFGGAEVASASQNRTAIIEFRVPNVDDVYSSLESFLQSCLVQAPTTMPWGNRSLLFRDPDGNLVNFFHPLSEEAVRRQNGQSSRDKQLDISAESELMRWDSGDYFPFLFPIGVRNFYPIE
ncbi:MAG: VOC family protein [Arcticibacter sp.]